jgi:hypothetical protein
MSNKPSIDELRTRYVAYQHLLLWPGIILIAQFLIFISYFFGCDDKKYVLKFAIPSFIGVMASAPLLMNFADLYSIGENGYIIERLKEMKDEACLERQIEKLDRELRSPVSEDVG